MWIKALSDIQHISLNVHKMCVLNMCVVLDRWWWSMDQVYAWMMSKGVRLCMHRALAMLLPQGL